MHFDRFLGKTSRRKKGSDHYFYLIYLVEYTPVPQMKTGNVLKHETMANLFTGKEYPVLI